MAYDLVSYRSFFVPNILLGIINIILNSTLIHCLRKLNRLKKLSFKFILILSISDILLGISLLVSDIVLRFLDITERSITGLQITIVLRMTIAIFSGCMTVVISVDRYIHIAYLTRYSSVMTKNLARLLIFAAVIVTLGSIGFKILGLKFGFYMYTLFISSISVFLGLIVIFTFYCQAYRSINDRMKDSSINKDMIRRSDARKEFACVALVLLASLFISVTPYLVLHPLSWYYGDQQWAIFLANLFHVFVYLNSTINAIIIIYFDREIRNHLKERCFIAIGWLVRDQDRVIPVEGRRTSTTRNIATIPGGSGGTTAF